MPRPDLIFSIITQNVQDLKSAWDVPLCKLDVIRRLFCPLTHFMIAASMSEASYEFGDLLLVDLKQVFNQRFFFHTVIFRCSCTLKSKEMGNSQSAGKFWPFTLNPASMPTLQGERAKFSTLFTPSRGPVCGTISVHGHVEKRVCYRGAYPHVLNESISDYSCNINQ